VDILSDMLLNSKFSHDAIESERSTILREAEEVSKDFSEVIFDHLHAAAFQGTSLGNTILGPEENIKTITRDDILAYTRQNYIGGNMLVVGVGGVNHNQLVDFAGKAFSSVPQHAPVARLPKSKTPFTGSLVTIRDDTMEDSYIVLAVEGLPASHPDYYTLLLVQTIIGNWDRTIGGGKNLSSKLCEIVATDQMCNSLTSFNTCYSDTGLFGVYCVAPGAKFEFLSHEIVAEWLRIAKLVTDSEVDRAKNKLKSSLIMQLDGTTAVADDVGRQILQVSRRLSPAEVFARIDAITTKDVMRVASDRFEDVDPVVVAIGQTETLPDYNRIRGWTYWNRW